MNKPFFSIIMPVYNKAPHINRSILSVINQSFKNFELIIVNDASTDNSLKEIVKFSDYRIRIFSRKKPGPGGYSARNLGIKKSLSKWIAFIDADDEWYNDHLYNAYNIIDSENDVELVSSGWVTKFENGHSINCNYFQDNYHKGNHEFTVKDFIRKSRPMWTGVVIARKSLLEKVGGFDDNWKHGADVSLWLKLLLNMNTKAIWYPKITAIYHSDTVNKVTSNKFQKFSPTTELIREYLKYNPKILGHNKKDLIRYANKKAMNVFIRQSKKNQIKIRNVPLVFIFSIYDILTFPKLMIYLFSRFIFNKI